MPQWKTSKKMFSSYHIQLNKNCTFTKAISEIAANVDGEFVIAQALDASCFPCTIGFVGTVYFHFHCHWLV